MRISAEQFKEWEIQDRMEQLAREAQANAEYNASRARREGHEDLMEMIDGIRQELDELRAEVEKLKESHRE
jgi:hypothetical protein